MSFPASNDRTLDIEEEEDEANDNKVNLNNKKSEIPFLRRNNCPNRIISRDMSIDICDESSSSLLMADTANDDQVKLSRFANNENLFLLSKQPSF